MKPHCTVDGDSISDEASFHAVFAETLGFPAFYGNNWDAWIYCMSYLDDSEAGMSRVKVGKGELFVLGIANSQSFQNRCPKVFTAFVECAAFVNLRCLEVGEPPLLAVVSL